MTKIVATILLASTLLGQSAVSSAGSPGAESTPRNAAFTLVFAGAQNGLFDLLRDLRDDFLNTGRVNAPVQN